MTDTDRFLAENLMGWHLTKDFAWFYYQEVPGLTVGQAEYYSGFLSPGANPFFVIPGTKGFWRPTKDITQALGDGGAGTVVGAMREKGWSLTLVGLENEFEACFSLSTGRFLISDDTEVYAKGKVPAEAISEAARAALESGIT